MEKRVEEKSSYSSKKLLSDIKLGAGLRMSGEEVPTDRSRFGDAHVKFHLSKNCISHPSNPSQETELQGDAPD